MFTHKEKLFFFLLMFYEETVVMSVKLGVITWGLMLGHFFVNVLSSLQPHHFEISTNTLQHYSCAQCHLVKVISFQQNKSINTPRI